MIEFIFKRWQEVRKNNFIGSVSILVGGTAFAQVLTIIALPVITRLYSPEDFKLLAVYTAILSMISIVACLRLDVAIPLPKDDKDAASLAALALIFSACFGLIIAVVIIIWPDIIVSLIRQPTMRSYLWLLPVSVWLVSSYSVVQYWATRKKRFSDIAKARVTQSAFGSGSQVLMGVAGFTQFGLLVSQILLGSAGVVKLSRLIWREDSANFLKVRWGNMISQLRIYENYPKYSTLDAIANTAGIQIPLLVIGILAIGPDAGYLLLAMRIMAIPLGLIGGATSQVYFSRASDEYRAGTLGKFTVNIISGLMKTGVGPLFFLGIIAPNVFPLIFGENWIRVGSLVAWMVPWMILQFIASPISMCMHVRNWQRGLLCLNIFGFLFRIGVVFIFYEIDARFMTEAYVLSGAIFYAICLMVFCSCVLIGFREIMRCIFSALPINLAWIGVGIMVNYFIAGRFNV